MNGGLKPCPYKVSKLNLKACYSESTVWIWCIEVNKSWHIIISLLFFIQLSELTSQIQVYNKEKTEEDRARF